MASAYSVLTHEAIIDSVWQESIKPLLLKRYPNSTDDDLMKARSYAYGGSLMEDMGYYPFGSKLFSDLIHYVRTGEFIEVMIQESQDLNEYAFALGALSHYRSDSTGHAIATNHAVPLLWPKLRKKYGNLVTYDEKPSAHIRAEFGFDVLQVARGDYLPEAYHDFIGFQISKSLLARVFPNVYSLELKDVLKNFDTAAVTFRYSVRDLIPELTKAAWGLKKDEIVQLQPAMTKTKFRYLMPRADFEKEWGTEYKRPGFFTRMLTFFIRIIPKIGPFKALAVKLPTPEAEKLFLDSYAATVTEYVELLRDVRHHSLELKNRNLDTGRITELGEYNRADKTYAKLLEKLAERNFEHVTPELKTHILNFFNDSNALQFAFKDEDDREQVLEHLHTLESTQISEIPSDAKTEFYFDTSVFYRH
ncbi:MAG TPA: zinc dependent phospholipase C family protein [Acidobacteriota bacterium]|nr:zinc dependent phospholipase C family protein [Acidobacteriota bacterium]